MSRFVPVETCPQLGSRHWGRGRSLFAAALAMIAAACGDATSPAHRSATDPALAAKGSPGGSVGTNTLKLAIVGLPNGTPAAVSVSGPNGYSASVTASTSLNALANGTYTVTGKPVTVGPDTYAASPASQSLSLKNGRTVSATVSYSVVPTTGTLIVAASITESIPIAVTVTGPNAYSHAVTKTDTLRSLPPGTYTVAAQSVTGATGVNYTPSPTTQTANVQIGLTSTASVRYAPSSITSPGFNLQIVGMYVVQSVQTLGSTVPLVGGRDGLLRVFALANSSNSVAPAVRVRFYVNGTLMNTVTVAAGGTSVPTAVDESLAAGSWNVSVPASLMQPGLSVLADVDPTNLVEESNETDNQFPLNGVPLPINVQSVPGLAVTFVPVLQSGTGNTGDVNTANAPSFLQRLRDIHPVNTVVASVHAPYTSSYTLGSDGTNWSSMLAEINTLRTLDGSNDQYYGVAHTTYTSGVAGIGYIGAPAALGWDWGPASMAEVMAHELGHNWGRAHAPCGGAANPDPSYPYAGGVTGTFGWNVRTNTLMQSTNYDLMGYCSPTWISDYNYLGVFNYRANTTVGTIISRDIQPGLLIWGTVAGDGAITLEPAVRVNGKSVLPARQGSFTAEGTDASGARIFSISFEPLDVSEDVPGDEQHFAFVIPMSDADHGRLRTLSVSGSGRRAERTARLSAAALDAIANSAAVDAAGSNVHAQWNSTDVPLVLVRNPTTGDVLSLARGGDITLPTGASALELVFSDGVHSSTRRAAVRGR